MTALRKNSNGVGGDSYRRLSCLHSPHYATFLLTPHFTAFSHTPHCLFCPTHYQVIRELESGAATVMRAMDIPTEISGVGVGGRDVGGRGGREQGSAEGGSDATASGRTHRPRRSSSTKIGIWYPNSSIPIQPLCIHVSSSLTTSLSPLFSNTTAVMLTPLKLHVF